MRSRTLAASPLIKYMRKRPVAVDLLDGGNAASSPQALINDHQVWLVAAGRSHRAAYAEERRKALDAWGRYLLDGLIGGSAANVVQLRPPAKAAPRQGSPLPRFTSAAGQGKQLPRARARGSETAAIARSKSGLSH